MFRAYDKATGTVAVGDRAAGGHDRRADDLHARRQAVHRRRGRRERPGARMGGVLPSLTRGCQSRSRRELGRRREADNEWSNRLRSGAGGVVDACLAPACGGAQTSTGGLSRLREGRYRRRGRASPSKRRARRGSAGRRGGHRPAGRSTRSRTCRSAITRSCLRCRDSARPPRSDPRRSRPHHPARHAAEGRQRSRQSITVTGDSPVVDAAHAGHLARNFNQELLAEHPDGAPVATSTSLPTRRRCASTRCRTIAVHHLRLEQRSEPVPVRRRRHLGGVQRRRVGLPEPGHHAGSPGQGHRRLGRVPRLPGRRGEHRHQVGQQQLRADGERLLHPPATGRQQHAERAVPLHGALQPAGDLRSRRTDRAGPRLVLRPADRQRGR